MKRIYTFVLFLIFAGNISGQRYLTEVFTDVDTETDINYSTNITVLPALQQMPPIAQPLGMDVKTPNGDTKVDRPLIIMLHTGNFLPTFVNGQINGDKSDAYLVSLAERLVKMGYVVALPNYRLGWNPLPTASQEVKTNTLINAAYRGVQDITSCARFFRKSVAEDNNPYGIDPDKIVTWGVGTGGYIAMGAATLDEYLDVVLPKFIGADVNGDGNPDPMVLEAISSDPFGSTMTQLNLPSNPGYSSEFQLCVNMGGALGDTSWVDSNDPPMIGFHVPTDPFAPYMEDILIVPTTGDLVVEVAGSYTAMDKANSLGLNDGMSGISDEFTDVANGRNDGIEGLFPFPRPNWDITDDGMDNPVALEGSPWEFWDSTTYSTEPIGQIGNNGPNQPCEGVPIEFCNWDLLSKRSNPDMSFEKATAYQDTILGYFAPRAFEVLNLEGGSSTLNILDSGFITVTPNPVQSTSLVQTGDMEIKTAQLYNLNGQIVRSFNNVNSNKLGINKLDNQTGLYYLQLSFDEAISTKKIIFK